jgi:hypothetical protein
MEDKPSRAAAPDVRLTYCDKCGRDDLIHPLKPRHFTGGSLCVGGQLRSAVYRPVNSAPVADKLYEAAKLALHAGTVCCGWDGDVRGQSTKDAADLLRAAIAEYEDAKEGK